MSGFKGAPGVKSPNINPEILEGSNIYSSSEILLLKWLELNYEKYHNHSKKVKSFADLEDGLHF